MFHFCETVAPVLGIFRAVGHILFLYTAASAMYGVSSLFCRSRNCSVPGTRVVYCCTLLYGISSKIDTPRRTIFKPDFSWQRQVQTPHYIIDVVLSAEKCRCAYGIAVLLVFYCAAAVLPCCLMIHTRTMLLCSSTADTTTELYGAALCCAVLLVLYCCTAVPRYCLYITYCCAAVSRYCLRNAVR